MQPATPRGAAAPTLPAPLPSAAQTLAPPKVLRDLAMVALAVVSVLLVLLDILARGWVYDHGLWVPLLVIDGAITFVFLVEFVWKLDRSRSPLRVLRENWFDLLGMIPLAAFVALEAALTGVPMAAAFTGAVRLSGEGGAAAGGLVRLFRLVRVVRIAQAVSRFLRATNMTFGEQVTKQLFDRYRRIIVAELTTPILVAGITMSQEIIARMRFLESAGSAIDAKRDQIHKAVMESLERNHVPSHVLARPLVEKIIHDVEKSVVNTVVDTLTGPELNRLTQETLVEVLENFKTQLQSPEGKEMLKRMDAAPPPGGKKASL